MITLSSLALLVLTGENVDIKAVNSNFSRRLLPYIIRGNRVDLAKELKVETRVNDIKEAIRLGYTELAKILFDRIKDKSTSSIRKIIQIAIVCNDVQFLDHISEYFEYTIILSFLQNRLDLTERYLTRVDYLDEKTVNLIKSKFPVAKIKDINNRLDDSLYGIIYNNDKFILSMIQTPNFLINNFDNFSKKNQDEIIYTLINFNYHNLLERLINKVNTELIFKYRLRSLIDKVPANNSTLEYAIKYKFDDLFLSYIRKVKPSYGSLRLLIEDVNIDLIRKCLEIYPGYVCSIFNILTSVNKVIRSKIINSGLLRPVINSMEDYEKARDLTDDKIKQIILDRSPTYSQLMDVINDDINITTMSKLLNHPMPFRRGKLAEILTWAVLSYHDIYYIIEPEVFIDGHICTPDIYIPRKRLYLEVKSGNIHNSYVNIRYKKLNLIVVLAGLASKQKTKTSNLLKVRQLLEYGI